MIANNNYNGRRDNGKHNILIIQYYISDKKLTVTKSVERLMIKTLNSFI